MAWIETAGIVHSTELDTLLAVLCLMCCLLGTPANLTALRYFLAKRIDIPTIMYITITTTDIFTCVLVTPVALTLFNKRRPMLYSNAVFRNMWGPLWEILPYYSVFLVFMLSTLRTLSLLKPLLLGRRKRGVVGVLLTYLLFLVVRFSVGVGAGYGTYEYETKDGYCWNHVSVNKHPAFIKWDIIAGVTLLAFPIIPVTLSCVTSVYIVRQSMTVCKKQTKVRATTTIIILTIVYIVFNIPVFINYIRLAVIIFSDSHYDFINPGQKSDTVHSYAWLFTYIMSVALNALVNPVVYYMRIDKFRKAIVKLWSCRTIHVNSSVSQSKPAKRPDLLSASSVNFILEPKKG